MRADLDRLATEADAEPVGYTLTEPAVALAELRAGCAALLDDHSDCETDAEDVTDCLDEIRARLRALLGGDQ